MCKLKSGIILKNRVFVPEYDSHSDMIKELGIKDESVVRVELSPENGDPFSDIDTWELIVDQDTIPDWYNEETYKPQMIEKVKAWAKYHIYENVNDLILTSGENYFLKNCKNISISGSIKIGLIRDNSTIERITDKAYINRIDGHNVIINCIDGEAIVENIGGLTDINYIGGNASIGLLYDGVIVDTVSDYAKISYIYNSALIKEAKGNAKIGVLSFNAKIDKLCENASVKKITGSASISKFEYISRRA